MSEQSINELDQIAAEAAKLDAENPGANAGGEVMPVIDPAQEWRDAAHMGCGLVTAMKPELKAEWTPDKLDALGDALNKCAERYGWTVGEVLGHPLLCLAFASWGLIAPLIRIERERVARSQQARIVETVAPVEGRAGSLVTELVAE